MTASSVWTDRLELSSAADKALQLAARFWFAVAVAGQWIFVYYVAAFYGGWAVQGNLSEWNKSFPGAYTPGHTMSNVAVATHLALAIVIMVGGPLQLIPRMRRLYPRFHRWNGRLYIPAVFLTSLAGLYMVWGRGPSRHLVPHLGVSLDAVLIMTFAALALRYALARNISTHQRWALRLFMVVNAGWFFRVGLMFWIFVNQGPAGFNPETFQGPFLNFLSFADYLLPLAVLELYLHTKERAGVGGRFGMAAALAVLTLAMGIGIVMATMVMWLPRM
jgi:hypothetical protein